MLLKSARRNATKIVATVALVAGAASVAGVGTFGAYTDTTSAETQVESGQVSVLMNGSEQGVAFSETNMAAGDQILVPVTIERKAGSLELGGLTVNTTLGGDPGLANALVLKVETCSAAVTPVGACAGAVSLYNGQLGAIGTAHDLPAPADWVGKLNADTKVFLRATLSLPTNAANSTQGKTINMSWSLIGTQRTAKTTVVTPSAIS